jgi:hypothetical protein
MRRMVGVMGRSVVAAGVAAVLFYGLTGATGVAVAENGSPYESLKGKAETVIPALEEAAASRQSPRRRPVEAMDGTGPISSHQCIWLGKRIINLLIRDDAMAANDFIPFYARFECSETQLADAFGCLVANLGVIENGALSDQIDDCWHDPALRVPMTEPESAQGGDSAKGGEAADKVGTGADGATAAPAAPPDKPASTEPRAPAERPQPEQPASGTDGHR